MAVSMLSRTRCTLGNAVTKAAAPRPASVRLVVRAQAQKQQNVQTQLPQLQQLVKPAVLTAVANIVMAMPASAEAGALFDFNLTLPIMVTEFLVLMVFLDKFWFTPVGKVLDDRDALLRSKLSVVKDNSGDLEKLAAEAEAILKAARSEVSALVNSKKQAKQAELDKVYQSTKDKVTAETDAAIKSLEAESAAMFKKLDAQVEKVSVEVLKRVLPEGVKV